MHQRDYPRCLQGRVWHADIGIIDIKVACPDPVSHDHLLQGYIYHENRLDTERLSYKLKACSNQDHYKIKSEDHEKNHVKHAAFDEELSSGSSHSAGVVCTVGLVWKT